jgi:hypothetical protein
MYGVYRIEDVGRSERLYQQGGKKRKKKSEKL